MWMFPKIGGFHPKSSIFIGFSIINHPFWGTLIFGNTHGKPVLEVSKILRFFPTVQILSTAGALCEHFVLESETFVTELYLSHLEKRVVKSCFSVETTRDPIVFFLYGRGWPSTL